MPRFQRERRERRGPPRRSKRAHARRHTCVVFASRQAARLERLRGLFRTPYCHVWLWCARSPLDGAEDADSIGIQR